MFRLWCLIFLVIAACETVSTNEDLIQELNEVKMLYTQCRLDLQQCKEKSPFRP